ncbi:MAG TPA: alanine racemase [Acidimicrobiales bacterium]
MTTFPASFASEELLERVRANLDRIYDRIEASGRDRTSVRVVAVTKTFGIDEIRAALALGLTTVGENYVDELCEKRQAAMTLPLSWHYLGALQSNKIARAASCAEVLCAVARDKELTRIASVAPGKLVDIQVDFTGQAQRNGAAPQDVAGLVARARALELKVRGLMVVAPPDETAARAAFVKTNALANDLGVTERSMGMSDDLELACELGSTEVRLGRALFGSRVS